MMVSKGFSGDRAAAIIRWNPGRLSVVPPCSSSSNSWTNSRPFPCNCSDLRGNEQLAGFQEGVQASGPPGSKEGCQSHFAVAALFRASPATDFSADYQVAQAPLGLVVIRWSLRMRHEDEQFPVSSTGQALDVPLNPPTEPGLHCQWVFQERTAQRQQPVLQRQLSPGQRASPAAAHARPLA